MGVVQLDGEVLPVDSLVVGSRTSARDRGYYEYPREVDTTTLAEELGVTKATFLEHLRKAKQKILTTVRWR